jgi:hypothetical protein
MTHSAEMRGIEGRSGIEIELVLRGYIMEKGGEPNEGLSEDTRAITPRSFGGLLAAAAPAWSPFLG